MNRKTLVCLSLIACVASLGPAAHAQTFSVIHAFTGGGDGANPYGGVTVRAGILYGTAYLGGNGKGTVYEIMHSGNNWITVPISLFSGGGANPVSNIVFSPDGHPYGTATGASSGSGIVFDLIVPLTICKTANCFWKENVLYAFQGIPDGYQPLLGDLIWDQQGNIYRTTSRGGELDGGTVFELQPTGKSWTESIVYSFHGTDGAWPQNGVIFDKNGNLFGTTFNGGTSYNCDGQSQCGTIFELTYNAGSGWVEALPYNFQNGTDGKDPVAGVIFDASGNLYGASSDGGVGGGGTVFELSPSGDTWTFKLLYSLSGPSGQNCGPFGTLAMDAAGSLYGTTRCDGTNNLGSVFKLTKTENGWVYISLHDFTGGSDGATPFSIVAIDPDGVTLYGTASKGGSQNYGVVWMIKP